ncbi:MAG: hypothetical protein ACQEXV_17255 [Bacillota bacterium]
MINAEIMEKGKVIIPHITLKLNQEGEITNLETRQELLASLQGLEQACSRQVYKLLKEKQRQSEILFSSPKLLLPF